MLLTVNNIVEYRPCRNLAADSDHFILDPVDYAAAEEHGTVIAIVHSHINESPEPSQADRVACEKSGLPWAIVGYPSGAVNYLRPCGYRLPLVGRVFQHGVVDCLSLIQDYYRWELGIEMPDYHRDDQWWLKGGNMYLDLYRECGFTQVADGSLKTHDVLLMQVAAPVPNHGAVYLGDNIILHHLAGRMSSRDVYGGYWRKCTVATLRHTRLPA